MSSENEVNLCQFLEVAFVRKQDVMSAWMQTSITNGFPFEMQKQKLILSEYFNHPFPYNLVFPCTRAKTEHSEAN